MKHLVILRAPRGDVWGSAPISGNEPRGYPRPITHQGHYLAASVPSDVARHYDGLNQKEQP